MKFNPLIPELYVLNFQKSIDFYTQILGFKIEYQREEPRFAFLSYQKSQLMIQQEDDNEDWHNGKPEYPFGRGLNFQIEANNVKQLVDRLKEINYPLKRGLKDSYYKVRDDLYGYREFLVMDPDGYLLRFSQPI
jgi:catechol 2,3-dioxygenase-like lactoylglutathione lyase family enzyme